MTGDVNILSEQWKSSIESAMQDICTIIETTVRIEFRRNK